MRRTASRITHGVLAALAFLVVAASANGQAATKVKFGPGPAFLPKGAKMAVISGDPMKSEAFVLQLKMPSGYTIPPHQHPTEENILVKSGAFKIGMGDKFDAKQLKTLKTGEKATAPAKMNHYARASGATVVEVSGTGPFAITYVATGNSTVPKGK